MPWFSSSPKPIKDQFYAGLNTRQDFTAWERWGKNPNHTNINDGYIPVAGFVKRFDYPDELRKLVDYGWKRSAKPNGPQPQADSRVVIGRGRSNLPNPDSPFKGFTKNQLASDWDHMKAFELVAAYTFRGDSRPPETLEASDGFHPPFSRTDDAYKKEIASNFLNYLGRKGERLDAIQKNQVTKNVVDYLNNQPGLDGKRLSQFLLFNQVMEQSRMHLRAMTDNSFMKSYISTTRDIGKAWDGAQGLLGGNAAGQLGAGDMGFIYVLRLESGFLLKTGVGGVSKQEAEVAHLGPIKWKDVYGFRKLSIQADADKNLYIRRDLYDQDRVAFKQVLGALSWERS